MTGLLGHMPDDAIDAWVQQIQEQRTAVGGAEDRPFAFVQKAWSWRAGYAAGLPYGSPLVCGVEVQPTNYALRRSKRSRFMTLFHALMKSFTNVSFESADA